MFKYLKAIYHILKNYNFYVIPVLISEAKFYLKYNKAFNKFKYLNSEFLSDSIPCSHFFLIKIKKFIDKRNVSHLCDLGSGYGKILYFFGNLNDYKIDGVELEKEIYEHSKKLDNYNIKIFNEDILKFDLTNVQYDFFIINDPLKKTEDFLELILKIKNKYKKIFIIFININQEKIKCVNDNLKTVDSFIISHNTNLLFCEIN